MHQCIKAALEQPRANLLRYAPCYLASVLRKTGIPKEKKIRVAFFAP